jgi:hypothetical protein
MERFFDRPPDSSSLRRRIEARGGASIFSPAALADNSRSDATSHGGFAGDSRTMTSVVMRALGRLTPAPETQYQPNAALIETEPAPPAATQPRQPDATPAMIAAEIHQPGDQPLAETAEPQTEQPTAPDEPARIDPEVAVAPRSGSAIIDVLLAQGWQAEKPLSAGATQKPPTRTGS